MPVIEAFHRSCEWHHLLQTYVGDRVPDQWRVFAPVHLDGVETGMPGLAGNSGTVGSVAGALRDEPGAE